MSARQIGTALWRVTGRRRAAPLPEPLELAPRVEDPAPLEDEGTSLYVTPAGGALVFGPSWPCGRNGHVPAADDPRVCHYCGEAVAA